MKGLKLGKITIKAVLLTITIVMAVLMLMSAWGGLVDPNTSTLFSLLTLGMPVVLIINVIIALVWLLLFKWKYALIPIAAIAISWNPVSTVCPLNLFAKDYDTDSTFRVMSFNVANFGPYDPNNHEPSKSMRYILDQEPDFVLLQEGSQERTYFNLSNVEMMRDEFQNKYPYHSDGWRDLMILSKYPYTVVPDSAYDREHEYRGGVYAKGFDILLPDGKQLRILNLHLRSIGMGEGDKDLYATITKQGVNVNKRSELQRIKRSLFDKLKIAFKRHAEEAAIVRSMIDSSPENLIVCGDFNEAPSSYCYRNIRGDDLRDAFQDCGNGITWTFHDRRMLFKIDHILYRGGIEAVDWCREKEGDSDHYPQMATFIWK
jgi:endonuclease/exonuclease/phosphatase (EEP) superfamily protein YafD